MRGTQLLGPISLFFIISILRIEHQKKHDSKKVQEKIIVLIFRFKSLVIIK